MPISAKNKLRGKLEEVQLGDVMAYVAVRVGDKEAKATAPILDSTQNGRAGVLSAYACLHQLVAEPPKLARSK